MNATAILESSRVLSGLVDSLLLRQLDAATEGVVVVDHHARIRWVSDQFCHWLAIPEQHRVTGRPIEELLPNSLMRQVVQDGKPACLELSNVNGLWLVETRFPIRNQEQRIIGAVGIVHSKQPVTIGHFAQKCRQLTEGLGDSNASLPCERQARYSFSDYCGNSTPVRKVLGRARQAAQMDATVLLQGETGTGKELLAHGIHNASLRRHKPFVCVDLAAIPENRLEAELFGDTNVGRPEQSIVGKIALADGGTLFLDDIGDLPVSLQGKLLRVLQEREYEVLGSNKLTRVNLRVIAASGRDLKDLVAAGKFRPDLFFRLNVLAIPVPALREHLGDLPDLCEHFLRQLAGITGTPVRSLHPRAIDALANYHWPGNVRELRNALEQAVIFSAADPLQQEDFMHLSATPPSAPSLAEPEIEPLEKTLLHAELQAIRQALSLCRNNRSLAARKLGISRANLYEKMHRLGLYCDVPG